MGAIARLGVALAWVLGGCSAEIDLGANRTCGVGRLACGDAAARVCVDPRSDPRHCGACGVACGAERACARGACCPSGACGGQCTGTRWEERTVTVGRESIGFFAFDLDGDGRTDIVTVDQVDATFHVFWGNPEASLDAPDVWPVGRIGGQIAWGDFDEDGLVDVVAPVQSRGAPRATHLAVMRGQPARQPLEITLSLESGNPLELAALDANGDGHLDVLTRRQDDGCLLLRTGDGRGRLAAGRCVASLRSGVDNVRALVAVTVAGRPALIVQNPYDYELLRFGDVGAVTSRTPVLTDVQNPWGLSAVDLDGDGVTELMPHLRSTAGDAYELATYRLQGSATTPLGCVTAGTMGTRIGTVTDFDGDGMLDIVAFRVVAGAPWEMHVLLRR